MKNGLYIYGIIKNKEIQNFDSDNAALPQVFTIHSQDLAAVVSINPLLSYTSLEQEKAVQDLAVHNFVIEKMMAQGTILPVKFGTMVETREEVSELLNKGQDLFRDMLSRMEGHIELDVVARWDLSKVLAVISREDDALRAMQQEMLKKGKDMRVEDKLVFGQYVDRGLKAKKAKYQQQIFQALQSEAEDVCSHDLAGDEMIFNAAFLLPRQHGDAFYAAIDAVDQALESNMNFRVVGPLPPYSFSTIEVKRLDSAGVEEARKILRLPAEFTDKSVRDAYYQLAKEYHPDKRNEEDSKEFQRIQAAYTMLNEYIENGLLYAHVYQWPDQMT